MPEPGDLGWLAAALVRTNFKETLAELAAGNIALSGADLSRQFPGVDLVCLELRRSGVLRLSVTIEREGANSTILTLLVDPSPSLTVSSPRAS